MGVRQHACLAACLGVTDPASEPFCWVQVDLLPLPEGVPEVLPVSCTGRRAQLILRTQVALHSGVPVAAEWER